MIGIAIGNFIGKGSSGSRWTPLFTEIIDGISVSMIKRVRTKDAIELYVVDLKLTDTGFAGVEDTDFEMIYNIPVIPQFITTWNTENAGSATKTIVIPTTGAGYDCYINFDGIETIHYTGTPGNITYVFPTTGIKVVKISGVFPQIYFNNSGDKLKLLTIEQWGTNVWTSMFSAFFGCANLTGNYNDVPNTSVCTSMSFMFNGCSKFNSPVNFNTSSVTAMSYMFTFCTVFNQSVSTFDTSKVTAIRNMFQDCNAFNQILSGFDTSNATDMHGMFENCFVFNSPLNFNTAKVTDMSWMFWGCTTFNQSVSSFDTSNVTLMFYMFGSCSAFNQSVASFNTAKVTDMDNMFNSCTTFNQSVSSFDTSNVTNMAYMFFLCSAFNQSVASFNVSKVTDMTSFIQYVGWSQANYNAALISWGAQAVQNNVLFDCNVPYSAGAAATARAHLVLAVASGGHGWTITDNGMG